ncbi:peptide/nickel transport system substrate-binding protein [Bradyrhizobium elkanii]|nr:peptide/nickel transport system substrate-binding protein [Bradyrhizobium elkanii]
MRSVQALAVAVLSVLIISDVSRAAEPKSGGIFRIYHRDSPGSASIHEGATYSLNVPFMPIFNNLVIFDQHIAQNSASTIRPELAESWAWSGDNKTLTFKLRKDVKWHDGKPFTAADVKCTFDMLMGKSQQKFRQNPRKSWYEQVEEVTTNGDYEASFKLKRPQPALLSLLASGYSPVYPCHVSPAEMRTKPVGTGPFKFVEFKANESIKLTKNPDYFKKGLPYLDGIEFTIIPNRSTAILGFVSGKFDMTFPTEVSIPLLKDVKSQAPNAVCVVEPNNVSTNIIINSTAPPFDNLDIRRALALALDRKAFIQIMFEGQGDIGGTMEPAPDGLWAMPKDMLEQIPGYGPDIEKNREEARKLMQKAGYGPDKHLQIKVSTRNIAVYRDPRDHPDRPDQEHLHRRRARRRRHRAMVPEDRPQGLLARPQPHRQCRRRARPVVLRELCLRLGAELHQLLQQGDREAVRPAVGRDQHRQAQEAGLGDRQEAAGRRRASDHLPCPHRHLLAALREECHDHVQQLI